MVDKTSDRRTTRLVIAAGVVLAVLPLLFATQRALHQGWQPVLDDSNIAAQAASFAHGHPPLLGAPSTSLEVATGVRPVNHLGPAEYYLLGVGQIVVSGRTMLLLTVLAVTAAAAVVIVVGAAVLGGPWAALAMGVVAGLVAGRLGTPIVADIWNPYVPILPLAAALVSLWAAVLARWRIGWPLAVLFGTLSAQSHLTHGPLLAAAAVPALVVWWRTRTDGLDDERRTRRRLTMPALASAVILVVFWLPPLLSELTSGHSNVANLWRALTKDTGERALGLGYALRVFSKVVAVPPPWGPPATAMQAWFVPSGFSVGAALAAAASVIPLIVLLVVCWGRDRTVMALSASCLAVDVMAVGLLSTSTFTSGVAVYQTRWLWAVSLLHWGGTAVAGVRAARLLRGSAAVSWAAGALLAVVAVAGASTVFAPPPAARSITPDHRIRIDTVTDLLPGTIAAGRHQSAPLVVHVDQFGLVTPTAVDLVGNLILRDRSVRVESPDRLTRELFGTGHAAAPGQRGIHLVITRRTEVRRMTDAGFIPVATVPPLSPGEREVLRRAGSDLRARFSRGDFRLTGPYRQRDARSAERTLFDDNLMEEAAFTGELEGRLPPATLMRSFTDLKRRDPAAPSAVVVWRSPR